MQTDSIDKIVESYFSAVTAEPFSFKGVTYNPPRLKIPTSILRGFTCPPGCGGCCPRFTLDYLPWEDHPYPLQMRFVEFNGRAVGIWSDLQQKSKWAKTPLEKRAFRCNNLRWEDGRCGIHGQQPFSCDFEVIGVTKAPEGSTWRMTTRLFTRGWSMIRTGSDERGSLCELLPATPEWRNDVVRKLTRLQGWATHFGLKTRVPQILSWISEVSSDVIEGKEVEDLILVP